jgi:23S rRNA U2552 (ribose-2'-O)-methylase RlmE/FtsJ
MNNYTFYVSKNEQSITHEQIKNINEDIKKKLSEQKNHIDNDQTWDLAKRHVNEYENIFSSSKKFIKICTKKPISRAYFKLWEILRDFHDRIFKSKSRINTAHIAEGPGGFIECLVDYKAKYNIDISRMYGITLLLQSETENRVPFWKLTKEYCKDNNIFLNRKGENIGDLYQLKNIYSFVNKVGYSNCELVTADGGFDFSSDFNQQEEVFLQLFLSEIYTAASIQSQGGTFITKIFDMFTDDTNCLISILTLLYDDVYIIKPFTSRPANSEKYLVCLNYDSCNKNTLLSDCRNEIINKRGIMKSLGKYYNPSVATRICMYNTYYANRQIYYLKKTLEYANKIKSNTYDFSTNYEETKQKCIEWCEHYEIDY